MISKLSLENPVKMAEIIVRLRRQIRLLIVQSSFISCLHCYLT